MKILVLASTTLALTLAPALTAQTTAADQQAGASQSRKVDQVDQAARERAKTASRDHANMDGKTVRDASAGGSAAAAPAAKAPAAADRDASAADQNPAAAPNDAAAPRQANTSNYGLWGLVGLLGLLGLGRGRRAVSRRSDYEGQNFRRVA